MNVKVNKYLKGMFGWRDSRYNRKCGREKWGENIFSRRLVEGRRGEKVGGAQVFFPQTY